MRANPISIVVLSIACSSTAKPTPTPPTPPTSTTPPNEVAPDLTPPALRLPGDVRPTRNDLELTIVPTADRVAGAIHIEAVVVRPTRVVWLDASGIDVRDARIDRKPARVVKPNDDFIGLVAAADLATGPIAIDIAFESSIDGEKSQGIYKVREADGESYAYTFFEPVDARRAFPCFNEPSYKVPWRLVFHVRKADHALANSPVATELDEPDGMKRVEFAETKPLPSYLVAFVVGPFDVVDGGTGGRAKTPIRFVVPKGRAGELGWAKRVTPRVVAALEDYFDMDYPYGKLDVAVVPRFWGTMEHPGIVAMGQPLTLIRPDQETASRKRSYANILAHELSHYWFGDLVTMAWWDDTWLNEALGEWLDMIITDPLEPAWRYREERVSIALSAMRADEMLSTEPIRRPVTTREGIQASFDGEITYAKGATVLRMLEAHAGPERWRDFIRAYVRAHAWGNATAGDFVAAMRERLGAETAAAFDSFSAQPGVPRVAIAATCAGGKATLHLDQTRALPSGTTDPVTRRWTIPVCARYGDATRSRRTCTMLAEAERTIDLELCPTWLVPNADASGYYRTAIRDVAPIRALLTPGSSEAKVAKPTAAERMMLVADLHAAADRGELTVDAVMKLAPLVAADPDDLLPRYAFEIAQYPANGLDDALYAAGRAWSLDTFRPLARKLGWKRSPADTDQRQQLRAMFLWVVAPFDDALSREATRLADRWLADRAGIDDDLVDAALGVAAYHGDAKRFERYLQAARDARDRTEQQRILRALGGFRDPKIAATALDVVLGHAFDLRDSLGIAYAVLSHRETRELGWAWLATHVDELLARMRSDEASWFLGAVSGMYCDRERRRAADALVTPRAAKIDGAQLAVSRGLEEADQCIALVARELPALRAVFGR
jgi:aminopeptidase N